MSESAEKPRWDLSMTSEERRTAILRSLGEILRERHMSSLTMQDIADHLGMTKGNLYYYFRSKRDILFECHMRANSTSLRLLDEVEHIDEPPPARLYRLVVSLLRSIMEDPFGAVLTTDLENLAPDERRR